MPPYCGGKMCLSMPTSIDVANFSFFLPEALVTAILDIPKLDATIFVKGE